MALTGDVQINRITNANVYLAGASLLGRVEECTLPNLKNKMAGHKALGMIGEFEFFSGIDKLEGKIKFNSFYADVMTETANPTKFVDLQLRSSVMKIGATGLLDEVPQVVFLKVTFKDQPLGGYKQHDNVETEISFSCYYAKLEIDGQEIIEYDVFANVFKVNGTDILTKYRANLGIQSGTFRIK